MTVLSQLFSRAAGCSICKRGRIAQHASPSFSIIEKGEFSPGCSYMPRQKVAGINKATASWDCFAMGYHNKLDYVPPQSFRLEDGLKQVAKPRPLRGISFSLKAGSPRPTARGRRKHTRALQLDMPVYINHFLSRPAPPLLRQGLGNAAMPSIASAGRGERRRSSSPSRGRWSDRAHFTDRHRKKVKVARS